MIIEGESRNTRQDLGRPTRTTTDRPKRLQSASQDRDTTHTIAPKLASGHCLCELSITKQDCDVPLRPMLCSLCHTIPGHSLVAGKSYGPSPVDRNRDRCLGRPLVLMLWAALPVPLGLTVISDEASDAFADMAPEVGEL